MNAIVTATVEIAGERLQMQITCPRSTETDDVLRHMVEGDLLQRLGTEIAARLIAAGQIRIHYEYPDSRFRL